MNISLRYTFASFNILRKKASKLLFIVSILTSMVFIAFYIGMIYIRRDKLVPKIIYSLLIFLTIVFSIIDILFYTDNNKFKNIIQKIRRRKFVLIKNNTAFILKFLIKLASVIYGIYLLLNEFNYINLILVSISGGFLILQFLLVVIISIMMAYFHYLRVALIKDAGDSKLLMRFSSKEFKANIITNQNFLVSKTDEKIMEEINNQLLIDESYRQENYKFNNRVLEFDKCKKRAAKLTKVFIPTNPKRLITKKVRALVNNAKEEYDDTYKNIEGFEKLKYIIDYVEKNLKEIEPVEPFISCVGLLFYFVYEVSSFEEDLESDKEIINLCFKAINV